MCRWSRQRATTATGPLNPGEKPDPFPDPANSRSLSKRLVAAEPTSGPGPPNLFVPHEARSERDRRNNAVTYAGVNPGAVGAAWARGCNCGQGNSHSTLTRPPPPRPWGEQRKPCSEKHRLSTVRRHASTKHHPALHGNYQPPPPPIPRAPPPPLAPHAPLTDSRGWVSTNLLLRVFRTCRDSGAVTM